MAFSIREKTPADDARLTAAWTERYGAATVVARGQLHHPLKLPVLIAEDAGTVVGAVSFTRIEDEIEIITLDSFAENKGVGTALLEAVAAIARAEKMYRLCLVTSNDNIRALRFYQKRGWNMSAFYRDAVVAARKLKPQIPLTGDDDIPIRHEIEFEYRL